MHHQQLAARELENSLREQLQLLQNQVGEKQAYAFSADDKLGKAQQEIAALHQHLGSLQALQDELQSSAARELEQTRGRFENELASLRSALAERDRSVLQNQVALLEIERGLRSEIDTLRSELEQRQAALGLQDEDCAPPARRSLRSNKELPTLSWPIAKQPPPPRKWICCGAHWPKRWRTSSMRSRSKKRN